MKKSKNLSFSKIEQKIIKIIEKHGPISITNVCKKFYGDENKFDKNNIIAGRIRRIEEKCILMDADWIIAGEGGGRKGRTVWIVQD